MVPPKVQVKRWLVEDFYKELQRPDSPYKDCYVIAMTQCKNPIYEAYLHEYVHLLICDKGYRRWTRAIAERKRRDDPDQVIIGVWPWIRSSFDLRAGDGAPDHGSTVLDSGFTGGEDHEYQTAVPILLRNVIFKPPLDIRSVANVLVHTHRKSPVYSLLSKNCYWYAGGVYEALKVMAGPTKENIFYSLQSMNQKRYVVYARLGLPVIKAMQKAAEGFLASLDNNPFRGPAEEDDAPRVIEDDPIGNLAQTSQELDQKFDEKIMDILEEHEAANNLDESATREEAIAVNTDLRNFTQAVLGDPEKERNLAAYNERVEKNTNEVEQVSDDPEYFTELESAVQKLDVDVLTEKEEKEYEEAFRAFVGSVLRAVEPEIGAGV